VGRSEINFKINALAYPIHDFDIISGWVVVAPQESYVLTVFDHDLSDLHVCKEHKFLD